MNKKLIIGGIVLIAVLLIAILAVLLLGDAPACEHSFTEWEEVRIPTCTTDGIRQRYCTKCDFTEKNNIIATGHVNSTVVKEIHPGNCVKYPEYEYRCNDCGETFIDEWKEYGDHEWMDVEGGYRICDLCGTEEYIGETPDVEPDPDEPNPPVVDPGEDDECTHDPVILPAVEPTCKKTGLTEGKKCSKCGDILVPQQTVNKLPHSPATGVCDMCGERHGGMTEEEVQNIIKVFDVSVANINSVGGVDMQIAWENTSNKTIKYIYFNVTAYNAVGDPVACDIRGYYTINGEVTGPIEPGTVIGNYNIDSDTYFNGHYWECLYYNSTIRSFKLNSIEIKYMDGTNVKISSSEIPYAYVGHPKGLIIEYNKELEGYEVKGYVPTGNDPECLEIPSTYKGKSVVSIDSFAFSETSLFSEIIIPDSITNIGSYAFSKMTGLERITIPESITSIGDSAFWQCSSLTEVVYNANIGDYDFGDDVFLGAGHGGSGITLKVGKNVTSLPSTMFYDSSAKLTEVIFEEGSACQSIGALCFAKCEYLETVKFADNEDASFYLDIDSRAFTGCSSLTDIKFPANLGGIGECAFLDCTSLELVDIPEGAYIGVGAFKGCTSVQTVNVNGSNISNEAFSGCTRLENLYISDFTSFIGNKAFYGCSSLKSLTLSDSVSDIGESAFQKCTSLAEVHISKNLYSIGKYAFASCPIKVATVPCVAIPLVNQSNLTHLTIDGGTEIPASALAMRESLKSLTICEGVKVIGANAFSLCKNIETIVLPDSVTNIGNSAFFACYNLKSITLSKGLKSIGNEAFASCRSIESITIPSGVTSIGKKAFMECGALSSITLPSTLTSIGDQCFGECKQLTAINYEGSQAQWKSISFGLLWNNNTGKYTVHCSDGDLKK